MHNDSYHVHVTWEGMQERGQTLLYTLISLPKSLHSWGNVIHMWLLFNLLCNHIPSEWGEFKMKFKSQILLCIKNLQCLEALILINIFTITVCDSLILKIQSPFLQEFFKTIFVINIPKKIMINAAKFVLFCFLFCLGA